MQENNSSNNGSGASKRRSKNLQLVIPPGHVSFRLLCHVTRIGGVIGKSGSSVELLRKDTGARIHIDEPINDSDERVIIIVAQEYPKKKIILKGLSEEEDHFEETEVSPAQEALIKVFERVLDVDADLEGVFPNSGGVVTCRLLAQKLQVRAVIGKGGQVIDRLRKDSGAKIRVLPAEKLPASGFPTHEVIQIMGDVLPVKKALVAISCCLQDRLMFEKSLMIGNIPSGTVPNRTLHEQRGEFPHQNSFLPPALGSSVDYTSRGHPFSSEGERITMVDPVASQQEVAFKLLCSNEKAGGVIGKGGTIVKSLQDETGAHISVGSPVDESDERVITISSLEIPESRYSPAQNAVVRVFTRSVEVGIAKGLESVSNKREHVHARLLVWSTQIGCLIGKGGTIISEIRKATNTGIWIASGDSSPKCVLENEQVLQISGELRNVQDALFHVTGRLRDHLFGSRATNGANLRSYPSSAYPSLGPPGILDQHANLTQSMDRLGLSHNFDQPSSSRWSSHAAGGGASNTMGMGNGLASHNGGLELVSGSKSAIVKNTTMEISVPEQVLGSIYGENNSNLERLRQISGAKVTVHDPSPGTDEGTVIISGTPDQTKAAQSLLQAFIISGPS